MNHTKKETKALAKLKERYAIGNKFKVLKTDGWEPDAQCLKGQIITVKGFGMYYPDVGIIVFEVSPEVRKKTEVRLAPGPMGSYLKGLLRRVK